MKKFYLICLLFCFILGELAAQNSSSVSISYGSGNYGIPIQFSTDAPYASQSWKISISEHNGRVIFEDSGNFWSVNGYFWRSDENTVIFAGIYYVVNISFYDANRNPIVSRVRRFSTPVQINGTRAPTIFFDGYSTDATEKYYQRGTSFILDYIRDAAQSEFRNARILLRGHAARVDEERKTEAEEQRALRILSDQRAQYIREELVNRGIEQGRISYEALAGSEPISIDIQQRWKNRRVEIFFVKQAPSSFPEKEIVKEEAKLPPIPEISLPQTDLPIIGNGKTGLNNIVAFILNTEPSLASGYVKTIVSYYIEESKREKINYDIAISQMLLETNFLRYTGTVQKEQYNFAGIGTLNSSTRGHWFTTELVGVRAHIQHLKGYATRDFLNGELVDPRYPVLERLGLLGSAPTVQALSGRWSSDPEYGRNIIIVLSRLYTFVNALNESKR